MNLRHTITELRSLVEGSYKDWITDFIKSGIGKNGGGPEKSYGKDKDKDKDKDDDGPLFPTSKEKKVDKRMQFGQPTSGKKPEVVSKSPLKSTLQEYPFVPTEGPDKGKADPTKIVVKGGAADVAALITATGLKPVGGVIRGGTGNSIAVFNRKEYEAADFGTLGRPRGDYKVSKWISAGGVVLFSATEEGLRKVLLVAPKGKFGGYSWSFPKGRVDEGESIVKTAKREVREETGITASLLPNGYLGKAEGTSSFTHYYMMVRVSGEPGAETDGESEKVEWVTWAEAFRRVRGSSRDRDILLKAWDYTRKLTRSLA